MTPNLRSLVVRSLVVLGLLAVLAICGPAAWMGIALGGQAPEQPTSADAAKTDDPAQTDPTKTDPAKIDAAKTKTEAGGDAAAKPADGGRTWWETVRGYAIGFVTYPLTLAAVIIIVAYALGRMLGRRLRSPDFSWKIGLVAFTVIAAGFIAWVGIYNAVVRAKGGTPSGPELKFGIDLRGGVNLVYQIKQEEGQSTEVDADALIDALRKRIDPNGTKQIVVRLSGAQQVEIVVPAVNEDEVAEIRRNVTDLGTLEFRILANRRRADHLELGRRALELPATERELKEDPEDPKSRVEARWVPMLPDVVDTFYDAVKDSDGANAGTDDDRRGMFTRALLGSEVLKETPASDLIEANPQGGKKYKSDKHVAEILVYVDAFDVEGGYLSGVSPGFDEYANPAVNFTFDTEGSRRFTELTTEFRPPETDNYRWHLGVVLNKRLASAPRLNGIISGRGQISGYANDERGRKERDRVISVLKAGRLPAQLHEKPLRENRMDSTLGMDTIKRSVLSMVLALALVFLFLIVYYRFSGLVACLALLLNFLLVAGSMIAMGAPLTLPGFAGMILSIGMAVDANVLIYERIREEVSRGSALRMAIRNGFGKALGAIIDGNVTAILTAIILYAIGTEQLKGFAVTLILGLSFSMYTAVFCSRLLFDIAERRRWLTEIRMMEFFKKTNYDFLSIARPAMAVSLVVIVLGLVAVFVRGKGLLDIDFTGGTAVQAVFDQELSDDINIQQVREDLAGWNQRIADIAEGGDDDFLPALQLSSDRNKTKVVRTLETEFLAQMTDRLAAPTKQSGETADQARARVLRMRRLAADENAAADSALAKFKEDLEPADLAAFEELVRLSKLGPGELYPALTTDEQRQEFRELARLEDLAVTEIKVEGQEKRFNVNTSNQSSSAVEAILEKVFEGKLASHRLTGDPQVVAPKTAEKPADAKSAGEAKKEAPAGEAKKEAPVSAGRAGFHVAFREEVTRDAVLSAVRRAARTQALSEEVIESIQVTAKNPAEDAQGSQALSDWTITIAAPEATLREVIGLIPEQPQFPASTNFSGLVSNKMRMDGIVAIVASWIGMLVYLWIRFQKVSFGVAAVVALIHDVLIALSFMAFSYWLTGIPFIDPFKIDLNVVAAFLTLIGYSVNDTIVIFDRIREIKGKSPDITPQMVNRALNETLARNVIIAGLTFTVVLAQFFFGGQSIHAFTFCLVIGFIAGTYSSLYISPVVLLWLSRPSKRRHVQTASSRESELVA